jgi:hypothetical protein
MAEDAASQTTVPTPTASSLVTLVNILQGSRRMLERYSHVHMEAKRTAMEAPLDKQHNGG